MSNNTSSKHANVVIFYGSMRFDILNRWVIKKVCFFKLQILHPDVRLFQRTHFSKIFLDESNACVTRNSAIKFQHSATYMISIKLKLRVQTNKNREVIEGIIEENRN